MKGPHPKPSASKGLRGNPGGRRLRREPSGVPGLGSPPDWLPPHARACWLDVAPLLERMGVPQRQDRAAFEALCSTYGRWRESQDAIAAKGLTFETLTDSGSVMVRLRPEVQLAKSAERELARWLEAFGLTPAARTRLGVVLPSEPGPMRRLLGERPRQAARNRGECAGLNRPPESLAELLAAGKGDGSQGAAGATGPADGAPGQ